MKKRRLPSLRRQGRETDAAGVGFEDLPPDERSSEVVMHPSPDDAAAGAEPDDTKPRPTMPASAVIIHDAPEPGDAPGAAAAGDDDYAFRPPSEPEAAESEDNVGDPGAELDPFVPDVVVDAAVRDEILGSLGTSTFVEGPPGSGISTILALRVVASVRSGNVGADSIAVVTRDEGAGAAFRDRLRDAFEEAADDEDDPVVRRRIGLTLARLRSTPIGPGVVLAERILRRWPEAAGVAPGFTVVPSPVARIDFEAAFSTWFRGPGSDEPAVIRALSRGVTAIQIHDIAEALTRHIGLLPRGGEGKPSLAAECDVAALRDDSARRIAELVELAAHGAGHDDGVVQIRALESWLGDAAGSDDAFAGHFLANAPAKVRAAGSRANWDPPEACAAQIERTRELHVAWTRARRSLGRSTLDALVEVLGGFVEDERARRMRTGRLFSTDVVPAALHLLVSDASVRRIEHDRHALVAVDDVWDVDAPTIALVLTLTSLSDDVGDPWRLRPGPGRLVVGGAAATATLRSRGADPRLVARLHDGGTGPVKLQTVFRQSPGLLGWTSAACRELFADDGDVQVDLFAATPAPRAAGEPEAEPEPQPEPETEPDAEAEPVDSATGAAAEVEPGHTDDPHSAVATNEIPLPSERTLLTPEGHVMSVPVRAESGAAEEGADEDEVASVEAPEEPSAALPVPDPAEWGPVVAAWASAGGDEGVVGARVAEAHAVAGALRMLVDSGAACVCEPDGTTRGAGWSDCAVVLGSGAGVETYLDALEAAGVPHTRRPVGVELLLRQEVQDLVAVLRAADDPTDVIATLGALRGLGFGCSDTDLVAAVACNGAPLLPTATPPQATPPPVAEALQVLARVREDARRLPALELIDLALDLTDFRTSVATALGADPGCIDAVRGLAAGWCGSAADVRTFLAYVDAALRPLAQSSVTQAPTAAGSGAVAVLTATEAQGREFPVVAVANMHRLRAPLPVAIADHRARHLHLRAGRPDRGFVSEGFDAALARDDEEYLAQRSRLVCSAFSRARDILLVAFTATAEEVEPEAEVPRRELSRRVARLLVIPDEDAPGGLRPRRGVTLVPVSASVPPPQQEPAAAVSVTASAALPAPHRPVATLGEAPDDPLRAALALAVSRADFENEPVATAPVAAEAVAAACREVGATGSEAAVADLLDRLMNTDLWARADNAERVLRRPSVFLDGGAAGAFSDRLDLALVEEGAVVGVALSLTGADGRLRTRLALGTHALAYATGLDIGAAVVFDARTAEVVTLDRATVDALVEEALT